MLLNIHMPHVCIHTINVWRVPKHDDSLLICAGYQLSKIQPDNKSEYLSFRDTRLEDTSSHRMESAFLNNFGILCSIFFKIRLKFYILQEMLPSTSQIDQSFDLVEMRCLNQNVIDFITN